MLITETVFRLSEVGEEGILELHYGSLLDFAATLKIATSQDLKFEFTTSYYGSFKERYGTKISYNSKNIVFTQGISVNPETGKNEVEEFCAREFALKEEKDAIPKYSFDRFNNSKMRESLGEDADLKLLRFNELFGRGEFPYINIIVIRVGNKDHAFYTIHR